MNNDRGWWNDFWIKQDTRDIIVSNRECETWYDLVWEECYNYWHRTFDSLAPGRKMLECGCGSAKVSRYMARHGYNCTLVDYSEQAIADAKSYFNSQNLKGDFFVGDINEMEFVDEQFDIVFSGGVLEFFDDVRKPIAEMVRVLKTGGIFAANIVPKKFSIQSIADFERTIVLSIRNLIKGRYKDVFKRVQLIPKSYNVSSRTVDDYVGICEEFGLVSVVGLVTSPFPQFSLPRSAERTYAKFIKSLKKQWRAFNESQSAWTKTWGITITIYGIKGNKT